MPDFDSIKRIQEAEHAERETRRAARPKMLGEIVKGDPAALVILWVDDRPGGYEMRVRDKRTEEEHLVTVTEVFKRMFVTYLTDADIDFEPGKVEVEVDFSTRGDARRGTGRRLYTFRSAR